MMRVGRDRKKPLVTVVMATYNGDRYIRQQLDSILSQSYTHIELIIVDDASEDNTVQIIKEFSKNDSRIHLVCARENRGVVATFEHALSFAQGDYIALSDQDDIFDHDKIEELVRVLDENPERDLVVSDLRLIDESGNAFSASMWGYQNLHPHAGKPFAQLAYANFATGCACMLRKRLLDIAMPFPENCIVHDWWFAVVASSNKAGGIVLFDRPLVSYRQSGSNVIGAHSGSFFDLIMRACKKSRLEQRMDYASKQVERLNGYLGRDELWNEKEKRIICELIKLFNGYAKGKEVNFFKRLKFIPKRVRYASTQNRNHTIAAIVFTLFPEVVDVFSKCLDILKKRPENGHSCNTYR